MAVTEPGTSYTEHNYWLLNSSVRRVEKFFKDT